MTFNMYLNYFSFNLEIMFSNKFLFLLFERTDYMYIYVYIYITYLYKVSIFDSVLSFTGKNLCKLTCGIFAFQYLCVMLKFGNFDELRG